MTNEMKLLRAFIDASGYEIKEVDVSPMKHDRYPHTPIIDYKVTKREDPLYVLYDGVTLRQLIENIIDLSEVKAELRWVKYPEASFDAVVGWFGFQAERANAHRYIILGVEVSLDEET